MNKCLESINEPQLQAYKYIVDTGCVTSSTSPMVQRRPFLACNIAHETGLLNIAVQPSGREWHPVWCRGGKMPQVTHSCLKVSLTGQNDCWFMVVKSNNKSSIISCHMLALYYRTTSFFEEMWKTKPKGVWKVSPDPGKPLR